MNVIIFCMGHESKGEITHLSGDNHDGKTLTDQQRERLKELASKLPPPKQTGPHIALNEMLNLKSTRHECEGESSIRMTYGNTNTVTTYQDAVIREDNTFRQHFVIAHIIFSKKPTNLPEILQQKRSTQIEKSVSVASLTVFYQNNSVLRAVFTVNSEIKFKKNFLRLFNHMKHAWTPSRNSMSIEIVAAELQIRLNCQMKCNEFFSFVQNEPELIKCARRTEKYNFTKNLVLLD
ncbi:unnamed protein product [Rotaria magnacalcarata]|uniref:Uncharacterized protein n=2 Tax=Rotaria magnacalcarata TaxID=392030 RepID=A0A816LKN9_9BILA|nr:unnamed protein product [Rotaria magnacalcarata]